MTHLSAISCREERWRWRPASTRSIYLVGFSWCYECSTLKQQSASRHTLTHYHDSEPANLCFNSLLHDRFSHHGISHSRWTTTPVAFIKTTNNISTLIRSTNLLTIKYLTSLYVNSTYTIQKHSLFNMRLINSHK